MTLAGFDPCGGAGATADLRVFKRIGAYGISALTAITPQNTHGVRAVHPLSPLIFRRQLKALLDEFTPSAAKIGQTPTKAIAKEIRRGLNDRSFPLVLDPMIYSTSGKRLVEPDAPGYMKRYLLPLATVITPNISEAAFFAGTDIVDRRTMEKAAMAIVPRMAKAVLITGGDGPADGAHDLLFDGADFKWLKAKRRNAGAIHGTGCHFSAALTAYLAMGLDLEKAAMMSKRFIAGLIEKQLMDTGGPAKLIHS